MKREPRWATARKRVTGTPRRKSYLFGRLACVFTTTTLLVACARIRVKRTLSHCADASTSEIFINVREHASLLFLFFFLWFAILFGYQKKQKIKIFVIKYIKIYIKIEEENCSVLFSHFQESNTLTTKILSDCSLLNSFNVKVGVPIKCCRKGVRRNSAGQSFYRDEESNYVDAGAATLSWRPLLTSPWIPGSRKRRCRSRSIRCMPSLSYFPRSCKIIFSTEFNKIRRWERIGLSVGALLFKKAIFSL